MTSQALSRALVACGVGLLAGACMMPSDHSGRLQLSVSNAPSLMRIRDSVQLSAILQDASGKAVTSAALRFLSSNPQILEVDSAGFVRAVGVGQANIQVVSAAFQSATASTLSIRVVGFVAVDSVRPLTIKFGQLLQVYGVGLSPDSITAVTLGGAEAPLGPFTAADPLRRDLYGVLNVWAAPPARSTGVLRVESGVAAATGSETIHVGQDDSYEANDTLAANLGAVTDSFWNPGLALEERGYGRGLTDLPTIDWYTFTTTTTKDMTVVLRGTTGRVRADVVLADSLGWGRHGWIVAAPRVIATSPYVETCGWTATSGYGEATTPAESIVVAVRGLPAGKHGLLVLYGSISGYLDSTVAGAPVFGLWGWPDKVDPLAGYALKIAPGYRSALLPDQFEPNNVCGNAAALTIPATYTTLTMDNPGRNDWYKFTAATAGKTYTFTLDGSVSSADIDLYLYRSFMPDSLQFVAGGFTGTPHEVVSAVLPAGNYFLVVADYAGTPTAYSLSTGAVAAAVAAAAPAAAPPAYKQRAIRERLQHGGVTPATHRSGARPRTD